MCLRVHRQRTVMSSLVTFQMALVTSQFLRFPDSVIAVTAAAVVVVVAAAATYTCKQKKKLYKTIIASNFLFESLPGLTRHSWQKA